MITQSNSEEQDKGWFKNNGAFTKEIRAILLNYDNNHSPKEVDHATNELTKLFKTYQPIERERV